MAAKREFTAQIKEITYFSKNRKTFTASALQKLNQSTANSNYGKLVDLSTVAVRPTSTRRQNSTSSTEFSTSDTHRIFADVEILPHFAHFSSANSQSASTTHALHAIESDHSGHICPMKGEWTMSASPSKPRSRRSHVQEHILEMIGCQTEEALMVELKEIIGIMGFDRYYYTADFSDQRQNRVRRILSNLDQNTELGVLEILEDLTPAAQAVRTSVTPIMHKRVDHNADRDQQISTNVTRNEGGDGVVIPINTARGNVGFLGYFILASRNDINEILHRSLGKAVLAAMYFHDAMIRITSQSATSTPIQLTPKERECLFWISLHKSNWDISRILGVSEHTIVYYVRRLMKKMNAQNRHEAVERAKAFSLI